MDRTLAVATSAIREAENGEEFLRRAREESGLSVRLISGREEARLIHLAVSRHVDLREKALLIDIGGGSVELTVADASKIYYSTSVKLGFLRLQGRFVSSDPMIKREGRALTSFVRDSLQHPFVAIRKHLPRLVVGTSGSITSLLRLAQQRRGESAGASGVSTEVSRDELKAILADLLKLPAVERARKFDLDPLRSEYLATALVCLDGILEGAEMKSLLVCQVALREGLIYDFMSRATPLSAAPRADGDLRFRAIVDLASRCDYPIDHSHRVAAARGADLPPDDSSPWSVGKGRTTARIRRHPARHRLPHRLFQASQTRLLPGDELRSARVQPRGKRAFWPTWCAITGAPSRRTSIRPSAALPAKARKTVKYLTAILRIADGLDMSHFSVVDDIKCTVGRKRINFQLTANANYPTPSSICGPPKNTRAISRSCSTWRRTSLPGPRRGGLWPSSAAFPRRVFASFRGSRRSPEGMQGR